MNLSSYLFLCWIFLICVIYRAVYWNVRKRKNLVFRCRFSFHRNDFFISRCLWSLWYRPKHFISWNNSVGKYFQHLILKPNQEQPKLMLSQTYTLIPTCWIRNPKGFLCRACGPRCVQMKKSLYFFLQGVTKKTDAWI